MEIIYKLIVTIIITTYQQVPEIILKGKPEIFTVDRLDNVYVYQGGVLEKYNQEGKKAAHFSSAEFGTIASIDVMDPMQIVLFFKEFNVVLLLDNNLNRVGSPFYLDKIGFPSIDAVCKSKELGLWFYDNYEQRIILYSFNPRGIRMEINLLKHAKPIGNISNIVENGNELYLQRQNKSILVYDLLGSRLSDINIGNVSDFQVRNGSIIYLENGLLIRSKPETEVKDTIQNIAFQEFDKIRIGNQKIFTLKHNTVRILTFSVHIDN